MPDPITGVSVANEAFVRGLVKNGAEVDIINTHVQKGVSSKQGSEFSFSKAFGFLGIYMHIFKVVGCDALYLTPGQTFFGILKYAPFILLARLTAKPYAIHLHGNYLGKEYHNLKGVKKKIFRWLIASASAGIVLSESLRKNFEFILPEDRIFVVENFVSDELMTQKLKGVSDGDGLKILFLSNLMKEKGILDLLKALIILKNKGVEFSAILAGAIEEEIRSEVKSLLEKLGSDVNYAGVLKGDSKAEALRRSNTFVLPTYYIMEGQPISILEAMASGHVIVTTMHAGIPDIAGPENGLFVRKQSPEDLAEKLEKIYFNKEWACKVAVTNRKLAWERFTESRFSDDLFRILTHVSKK
jgi:glycosyltransferase involved in cell wall biosynthesis